MAGQLDVQEIQDRLQRIDARALRIGQATWGSVPRVGSGGCCFGVCWVAWRSRRLGKAQEKGGCTNAHWCTLYTMLILGGGTSVSGLLGSIVQPQMKGAPCAEEIWVHRPTDKATKSNHKWFTCVTTTIIVQEVTHRLQTTLSYFWGSMGTSWKVLVNKNLC